LSTKIASILAILTLLVFGGVIALQVMEWQFFAAPPSVWPSP
jgi:hypothetical protein